jgi:hypothetical protein
MWFGRWLKSGGKCRNEFHLITYVKDDNTDFTHARQRRQGDGYQYNDIKHKHKVNN